MDLCFRFLDAEAVSTRLVQDVQAARKEVAEAITVEQKGDALAHFRRSLKRLSDWTVNGTLYSARNDLPTSSTVRPAFSSLTTVRCDFLIASSASRASRIFLISGINIRI
jgi:hypothetical protein